MITIFCHPTKSINIVFEPSIFNLPFSHLTFWLLINYSLKGIYNATSIPKTQSFIKLKKMYAVLQTSTSYKMYVQRQIHSFGALNSSLVTSDPIG